MAPSPVESFNPLTLEPGSIAYVAARLALWGRRAPQGMARVEFDSEYSRQAVAADVQSRLAEADILFHEIKLPLFTPAPQIVLYLKEQFAALPPGVVSISGWATAFPPDIPLEDSLRVLNYNRENMAQYPLCQIWWLTRPFADTVIRTIPDLNSWFIVRLDLKETIVCSSNQLNLRLTSPVRSSTKEIINVEEAHEHSKIYVTRLHKALKSDETASALVRLAYAALGPLYHAQLKIETSRLAQMLLDEIIAELRSRKAYQDYNREAFSKIITWQSILGSHHYSEFSTISYLGFIYDVAEQASEAEAFYKFTFDNNIKSRVEGHAIVDTGRENLVSLLRRQKRYDEAAAYSKYLIAFEKTRKKPVDVILANNLHDLAKTYCLQEKYADAEALLIQALSIQQKQYGKNNPYLTWVLSDLANLYKMLGRMEEANTYQVRVDAISTSPEQNQDVPQSVSINQPETQPAPSETA